MQQPHQITVKLHELSANQGLTIDKWPARAFLGIKGGGDLNSPYSWMLALQKRAN